MASLSRSPYGVYALTFRYGGQRIHRSLQTTSAKRAAQMKATVELALEKLQQGHLSVPGKITRSQLWRLLLSGGKSAERTVVTSDVTLGEVCRRYAASYTRDTKDAATLDTGSTTLITFSA